MERIIFILTLIRKKLQRICERSKHSTMKIVTKRHKVRLMGIVMQSAKSFGIFDVESVLLNYRIVAEKNDSLR